MNKKQIIGVVIFVAIILGVVAYKIITDNNNGFDFTNSNLTTIYVATGGGKEDFLADERVNEILRKKYKINVVYDTWSNGKTVLWPLIREKVGEGNKDIIERINNGENITIHTDGVTKYDVLFTSDQRFYDYYKLYPDKEAKEADRYTVLNGGLTLNTPIVIYSWGKVVDALINENIVTKDENGVYFITNMEKLMNYILSGKKMERYRSKRIIWKYKYCFN